MSLGISWLMASWSAASVKGVLVVVLGPFLGGIFCLVGGIVFVITTIRFRMLVALLVFVLATTGIAYGAHRFALANRVGTTQQEALPQVRAGE
jgi:hypothetical protein